MKEYEKRLEEAGKNIVLTPEDLHNLYDLIYMMGDDVFKTLKLNKMDKWVLKFREKIERIVLPELYKKPKKIYGRSY